ncbi:hypothetical protein HJB78_00945 [Rhizobium lentis]|uniref:hypothetical protein n=1 Tax=Rhizobium lentis TaxID=1138194 RepID=UPI001C83922B|nr:hypothetical protein [Rhizobium lentis]MBX5149572.1 hypothetical protein [Rhizobium lentis]
MDMTTLQTLQEAIAFATSAVGLTGKAAEAANAVKGLLASGKPGDAGEAASAVNALLTELTSANMMNLQLSKSLRDLSVVLEREDQFAQQRARYKLTSTPYGDLVLQLRAEKAEEGEPMHYICPTCFNKDRVISILQGDRDYKSCQVNNVHGFTFNRVDYRSNEPDPYF